MKSARGFGNRIKTYVIPSPRIPIYQFATNINSMFDLNKEQFILIV